MVTASTGEYCSAAIAAGNCSIQFNTAVNRTMTASYSGDAFFSASTSAAANQSVRDFAISATPSTVTISSGKAASYTLTVRPLNGMTGQVVLSCSGAPTGSICSISPSTIAVTGTAKATVTLSASKRSRNGTTFPLTSSDHRKNIACSGCFANREVAHGLRTNS
jgi:hypothetical protein